ncbi:hypothetical protein ACFWOJ_08815 [Streptomyces sp. NPDC058439]|uniref:hypothetical protein n=1 Tax=Streptomyces sp. NPDC058439 TaxID=3346500 RepID=UPI0036666A20
MTLVNAQERFTERRRLHMTATGQRLTELSIPELLEGTGAQFVRGWVTAVDADAKTVRIDDDRVLHYDTLVYGLGSVADTAAVPGVEDHAYTLDSARGAEVTADRLARLGSGTVVVGGTRPRPTSGRRVSPRRVCPECPYACRSQPEGSAPVASFRSAVPRPP